MGDMIGNLIGFRSLSEFKKAALFIIASQLNEEQIRKFRDTFTVLDSNGDGVLTTEELKAGLRDLPDDFQIGSKSGVLGYSEFIAAMLDRPGLQEDICYSAFRMFDKDGNNKISKDEIRIAYRNADIQEDVCNSTVSEV